MRLHYPAVHERESLVQTATPIRSIANNAERLVIEYPLSESYIRLCWESSINITVEGLGYVDLSLARLLSKHNDVVVIDINEHRVAEINNGISPLRIPASRHIWQIAPLPACDNGLRRGVRKR